MLKNIGNKSNTIPHSNPIKHIRIGSIVTRCSGNLAVYYKVADILDGCTEPIVAKQSKTLVLEFIGTGAKAVENFSQKIHYIADLAPYAQISYMRK